ncbi:MAG: AzlD domain-containing protein [Lachnospiraceae bacterium]|nr:AzlD domain-containing protein [Lachnospiraceae bacterium]
MNVWLCIAVMALVTYLIRAVPLTVFHRKIENRYVKSFLYYVPYTCLTAMTFPAILYATESMVSAFAGVAAAVLLAFWNKSLVTVAAAACLAVFVTELFL